MDQNEETPFKKIKKEIQEDEISIRSNFCEIGFKNEMSEIKSENTVYVSENKTENLVDEKDNFEIDPLNIKSEFEANLNIECNLCNKKFTSKNLLKDHLFKIHRLNEDYTALVRCHLCFQNFISKELFIKHFLEIHQMLKINSHPLMKCKICSEQYTSKTLLKEHEIKKHQLLTRSYLFPHSKFHYITGPDVHNSLLGHIFD